MSRDGPSTREGMYGLEMSDRCQGEATVLAVAGNVDMAAAPALADRVAVILRRRPAVLIIDLSEVNFLTTAGMSVVLQAHYRGEEISTSCRVVADGPVTARPMQLLGIDELLDMYRTVDAALLGRPHGEEG